jgi:ABC-type transporter Mla maintaining outer membrane lipid asymmetry ATPase subunit MlaF
MPSLLNSAESQDARRILSEPGAPVVVFDHVQLAFDDKVVLRDVSFTLIKGHTKIILGASGSGKSTALKIIVGLLRADAGVVWVNGQRVDQLSEKALMDVRDDLGMIFQEGALFDSLTVRENVGYKLYEETNLPLVTIDERVSEVLGFIGLGEHIGKMPSELSGGQRRRVAIARAMAFKPSIMLYDEATTGLDPITARWTSCAPRAKRSAKPSSSCYATGSSSSRVMPTPCEARTIRTFAHFCPDGPQERAAKPKRQSRPKPRALSPKSGDYLCLALARSRGRS